jgi:hypothetical protein
MAAVSYSINRGVDGFKITDFTHGTLTPNANDIEVRVNTTDLNGAALKVKDVVIALEAVIRAIEGDAMFGTDWGV